VQYLHLVLTITTNNVNTSGQPIAWAITDTEDTNSYEEFFKAVKARVPDASIKTVMTDDGKWCTYAYRYAHFMICYKYTRICTQITAS